MKNKNVLVPVKKIIKTINSCQNEEHVENCKSLIHNYIKSAKKSGVVNINDLSERLNEELLQKQENLYLIKTFTG